MIMKYIVIVVCVHLFTFGCATATGPLFTEVPLEEYKGKAVVYFYRNSQTGGAWAFNLELNAKVTLPLLNKGYHLLVLEPGDYKFKVYHSSKILAENKFALKGDEIYYIRYRADIVGSRPGPFTVGPIADYSINSIARQNALEVLKECRLIEVSSPVDVLPKVQ